MAGSAQTEAEEFGKIYKLEVVTIPTNRPVVRADGEDRVYRSAREKWESILEEIKETSDKGRPVLVGTTSVEKSEMLSNMLKRKYGVEHEVLNAKQHQLEAQIVAKAGHQHQNVHGETVGNVTIATNMAGRGTDIKLTSETTKAGGLHVIGTERHTAPRIDNQLRGRGGRQGDPGSSRFYLSLEDDLMRIFGSDRISGLMQKLGMEEGVPIEHGMVTRAIERAQKQVEARNFEIRKHLLEYDDVNNKQRTEIYSLRRELLEGKGQREYLLQKAEEILSHLLDTTCGAEVDPEEWRTEELRTGVLRMFGLDVQTFGIDWKSIHAVALRELLWTRTRERYEEKERSLGGEMMRQHERALMLYVIDTAWKDHLLAMDHLKEGIGLRGYGQRDPLTEYKKESFEMFGLMGERIEDEIIMNLWRMDAAVATQQKEMRVRRERDLTYSAPAKEAPQPAQRAVGRVGRNDPCPCGSGKKYKRCHGSEEGKGTEPRP